MNNIYKYPIEITDSQEVNLPRQAKIIHVGLDPLNTPCLWAIVNSAEPNEKRKILVCGTGHLIDEFKTYIGSFNQGPFVWHVFEN